MLHAALVRGVPNVAEWRPTCHPMDAEAARRAMENQPAQLPFKIGLHVQ
jgi:hypothetical protein